MAPKAKAGGRPKAMAAMRRPAVAGGGGAVIAPRRRGLRRPAALGKGQTPWELGQEVDLHTVPLDKLAPGLSLAVTKAEYFGGTVKIAGTIVRVEQTRNDVSLWMELSGTDSEAILESPLREEGTGISAAPVLPNVRSARKRRLPPACPEGQESEVRRGRRMGDKPRVGKRRPSGRRAGGREAAREAVGSGQERGCEETQEVAQEEQVGGGFCRGEGQNQEEEKEKGEVRDAPQWATCVQSSPKEFGPALRRYGLGPAGKDTASSPAQGQSFCSPRREEEQALQLECLQRELKLLDEQHVSSGGGRGGLHGRNEGQAAVREVSGSAGYGNAPKYAEEPFGDSGGTRRCPVRQACRPVVLSQHTGVARPRERRAGSC